MTLGFQGEKTFAHLVVVSTQQETVPKRRAYETHQAFQPHLLPKLKVEMLDQQNCH